MDAVTSLSSFRFLLQQTLSLTICGVTATREGLAKFLTLLNPDLQPAAQLRQTG